MLFRPNGVGQPNRANRRRTTWVAGNGDSGRELRVVGETLEGLPVIDGGWVFYMTDTKGLHLTDVLCFLKEQGMECGWPGYIEAAEQQGWKEKTYLSRVREGITDCYGKDWFEGWQQTYERWKETRKCEDD